MRRTLPVLLALVLVACGNDDARSPAPDPAPTAPASGPAGTEIVAGLGDSITAGSPLWDPDPAFRVQIAAGRESDEKSQWGYWYEQANPGERVRNCGVFGERTDEIAQRLDACAKGAGKLVVQGGINDIAQGRPVADAADDLESMVERGKPGREVLLVEVLPWNNGYPAAVPEIDELNRLIRGIGKRQDVRVLRWYDALEDPAAPDRMRADLTIDGDHPSIAGYERLAKLVRFGD